jgi:hypothetical protein
VAAARASPSPVELRAFLGRTLVPQMVPTVFGRIEALPLTPSGKLDRRALPVPEGPSHAVATIESPRGPTEEKLAQIWAELLGVERVGVHQDFFDLGRRFAACRPALRPDPRDIRNGAPRRCAVRKLDGRAARPCHRQGAGADR